MISKKEVIALLQNELGYWRREMRGGKAVLCTGIIQGLTIAVSLVNQCKLKESLPLPPEEKMFNIIKYTVRRLNAGYHRSMIMYLEDFLDQYKTKEKRLK